MLRIHSRFLFLLLLFVVVAPVMAAPALTVTITHNGNAGVNSVDFATSSDTGTVTVTLNNTSPTDPTAGDITLHVALAGGLTLDNVTVQTGATFLCDASANCITSDIIPANGSASITFTVIAPGAAAAGPFTNSVTVTGGGAADANASDATAFAIVTPVINLRITGLTHVGNTGANNKDFFTNTNNGTVTATIQNTGTIATTDPVTLTIILDGGLTFNAGGGTYFMSCGPAGGTTVTCTSVVLFKPGEGDTITFTVNAPGVLANDRINRAFLSGSGTSPTVVSDPVSFSIVPSGAATATSTGTVTVTPLPTFPIPTFTPVGTLVGAGTAVATATLIPNPPTSTPVPRPANAGQAVGPIPRPGVTVVVDRDGVNVRLLPALGAEVIANVNAGFTTDILARSPDNEWVQVLIGGQLGWIGTPVLAIIAGDLNAAPVADPRTIPYGGFENPRAGITNVTSSFTGKLQTSGLRVRGGPSRAYPVLANAPRYTIFPLLGRTADNVWLQVNFEGTLGWVATQFVELQQGLGTLDQLPIDGIVADGLPISQPTTDSYNDTLSLMQARLDLAQPSLDAIRAIWTSIALGQRAQCANFPARPTGINIPNPVLAPFYATLYPLNTDFNDAMAALRQAIDLFIDVCRSQQPTDGLVGQPVVQNALDAINRADTLFVTLRQRLAALLPASGPVGDDECLFTFQNRSQIVPRLRLNEAQLTHLTARNFVTGFCFDAGVGQSLKLQALRFTGNAAPRLTVSAFNNPTNFIGSSELSEEVKDVSIQPIMITETGRYIVIVADLDGAPNATLDGQIALLLSDVTGSTGLGSPTLSIDAAGNLIVTQGGLPAGTPGVSIGLTPGISVTATRTPIPTLDIG